MMKYSMGKTEKFPGFALIGLSFNFIHFILKIESRKLFGLVMNSPVENFPTNHHKRHPNFSFFTQHVKL